MPSKIKNISVVNLKAIGKADIDLNGCTVIVTGGNNKGKTSLLRSLMDRMRSIKSDRILKQGESEGQYEMELTTGEKFVWKFQDSRGTIKEKLTFITEKNIPTSLTKEINTYYFPKVFDIDRFLEEAPGKQKEMLEKIAGIDFTEINKQIVEAKETRAFQKRKVADDYARLGQPVDENMLKELDTSFEALQTQLNNSGIHNEKIKGFLYKLDATKTTHKTNLETIVKLKADIKILEDANMELEVKIDAGDKYIKEPKNAVHTDETLIKLRSDIKKITDSNERRKENNIQRDKYAAYDKAVKNQDESEKEVERLEKEKLDAVKNAHSLPEGFGFTDDGITYNGYAFNKQSLSLSAIYIAALKLASIGLGEVKALHFEASALDKNSLKEIEAWAKTEGLQLLIERPDFEGGEIEYQIIDASK